MELSFGVDGTRKTARVMDLFDPWNIGERKYPQTWVLLDVLKEELRVRGREVVDLSPGAVELRQAVRDLRGFAEEREHWFEVGEQSNIDRLGENYRRSLSFGPELRYCVERDTAGRLHEGEPFRHLGVWFGSRVVTAATSAEIALYFYGRRPAVFGKAAPDRAHGFIGLDWKPLAHADARELIRREQRFA